MSPETGINQVMRQQIRACEDDMISEKMFQLYHVAGSVSDGLALAKKFWQEETILTPNQSTDTFWSQVINGLNQFRD